MSNKEDKIDLPKFAKFLEKGKWMIVTEVVYFPEQGVFYEMNAQFLDREEVELVDDWKEAGVNGYPIERKRVIHVKKETKIMFTNRQTSEAATGVFYPDGRIKPIP